jgi:hypothetical protein
VKAAVSAGSTTSRAAKQYPMEVYTDELCKEREVRERLQRMLRGM